jgi:hypothetical protein
MKSTTMWFVVLALLATVLAPVTSAATPVTVRVAVCLNLGGERTVPPDSTITLVATWRDIGKGSVIQFLDAVTVSLAIDGTPVPDVTDNFGPIELAPSGAPLWQSEWQYDTGVTLENPGDEMIVTYSWVLDRRIRSVGQYFFVGPGEMFSSNTCTIKAVTPE